MDLYRIKQFYWLIISKVSFDDRKFVEIYLKDFEKKLFYKLPTSEQKHCIRVAMDIKKLSTSKTYMDLKINWNILIKAGLLHDIGKIKKPLNFFDKSILVILDWITSEKLIKFTNIDNIYIYYYHGEEGCKLLKNFNEDEQLLYIIKNHHKKNIHDNIELNILKMCDSRN